MNLKKKFLEMLAKALKMLKLYLSIERLTSLKDTLKGSKKAVRQNFINVWRRKPTKPDGQKKT